MIRNHPNVRRGAALVAGGLFAVANVGGVAAHGPDPTLSDSFFGPNQALTFDWRSGSTPPANLRTAIKAAAADVNATRASRAATFVAKDGAPNPIGYGLGATCGAGGIACFTRNAPNGFTMWFREQGHRFDWGALDWCQFDDAAGNGCFDVETIALDEFGHVEGLDHHVNRADASDYEDAVVQTVSHAKPAVGWNQHRFGACDVATLQREYDVLNSSTPYSTCLDLDTDLALAASTPSVTSGGTVALSATLDVGDLASYERLRNNPISGRTVTLQRRAFGATTWITVGSMPAGSVAGTYVLAQRITASWEYRAVFKAPTGEGIGGSTSPTVSVRAVGCATTVCPQIVRPTAAFRTSAR